MRFTKITVVVGEPIYFTPEELSDNSRETYQRLSDRVMEGISKLTING